MKSLREVCQLVNVSRRMVQGYEKAGLVKATEKNKYGHLLYDSNSVQRIELIRKYQRIGFSLKDISEIIDSPFNVQVKRLQNQLEVLKEKQVDISNLITELEQWIRDECEKSR